MHKAKLLFWLLAPAAILAALWLNQPDVVIRDKPEISAVAIDQAGNITISAGFAQSCSAPAQADIVEFAANMDIQLYRQRSSRAACSLRPQTVDIMLPATSQAATNLIVNNRAWSRNGDESSFQPLRMHPVHIEFASLALTEPGDLELTLRGNQSIGCELPLLYRLRQRDEYTIIGVYNALAADSICPDRLVEIETSARVPATEAPDAALFLVNDYPIAELETATVSAKDKVLTNIMSVDARVMESYPMRISLDVRGEHPDGCDLPAQVSQSRTGNTVTVEVYREVPADMLCPMILRPYHDDIMLDGDFESGSYTIRVNSHSQTVDI